MGLGDDLYPDTESPRCESLIFQLAAYFPTIHPTVHASDFDIILRSCDRVLFRVHRRNLEVHSEGFAGGQAFSTQDEVVDLTETSAVLDLLLQYIYPQPPPDLAFVNIKLLLGLAEAAEKYFFHAVIQTCKLYIKSVVDFIFKDDTKIFQ